MTAPVPVASLTDLTPIISAIESSNRPVALVTGGTSGIGRAITEDLSKTHLVIATGRDPERLASVAATDHVVGLSLDLENPSSFAPLGEAVPRIDVLVHDAAFVERFRVEHASVDDWNRAFTTNVVAPAELSRVLLPQLAESSGVVVFIGSGAARRSVPNSTVYSATKHALQALADGLRQQVAADGIRVSTVAPGPTHTRGAARSDRYGEIDRDQVRSDATTVARAVRFIVETPGDSQIAELWVRPRIE